MKNRQICKRILSMVVAVFILAVTALTVYADYGGEPHEIYCHEYNYVNGTVIPDISQAAQGETVTLTVIPNDGYKLLAISLDEPSGSDWESVEISGGGGTWSFIMPNHDVSPQAVFILSDAKAAGIPDDAVEWHGSYYKFYHYREFMPETSEYDYLFSGEPIIAEISDEITFGPGGLYIDDAYNYLKQAGLHSHIAIMHDDEEKNFFEEYLNQFDIGGVAAYVGFSAGFGGAPSLILSNNTIDRTVSSAGVIVSWDNFNSLGISVPGNKEVEYWEIPSLTVTVKATYLSENTAVEYADYVITNGSIKFPKSEGKIKLRISSEGYITKEILFDPLAINEDLYQVLLCEYISINLTPGEGEELLADNSEISDSENAEESADSGNKTTVLKKSKSPKPESKPLSKFLVYGLIGIGTIIIIIIAVAIIVAKKRDD